MKRKRYHGRADHCDSEGARGRGQDGRAVPQARDQRGDLLQVEGQVRRAGSIGGQRLRALEDENARLKKLLAERCWTTRR